MAVIEVRDLQKSYGETAAVRGVSFGIEAGEGFCLLGPNGAGKTTTVEIIEGHPPASAGSVSVLRRDPGKGERGGRGRAPRAATSGRPGSASPCRRARPSPACRRSPAPPSRRTAAPAC